jgi:hypothetical protein
MRIVTREEYEAILWMVYRRGAIHGGLVAVATATVWLLFN